ncbi:hypothetical protein D3C81_1091050 [compost metagenome]
MKKYTGEELKEAMQVISSTISNCEKMHQKFAEGTSQHTLLKNRIKSLYISKLLIMEDNIIDKYTKKEFIEALPPISSIISKCEKAQLKFTEDSSHYKRLKKIIQAMHISKSLIEDKIGEMD